MEGRVVTEVRHGIIRASAGSGKTWQLARRFIRLLALKVAPEKIAALTFTRKAAGEFFDRILRQLADLATEPGKAADYLEELKGASRSDIIAMLRKVIASMDRLRLGTMDSFFAAMVRCLPFDFGLSGMGALLSEEEQTEAMEDALDALLREAVLPGNDAARAALLEAWKRAFAGREPGSPLRDLDPWLRQMHPLFLASPEAERWGDPATIWPDKSAPVRHAGSGRNQPPAKADLEPAIDRFTPEGRKFWNEFFAQLENFVAGEPGFEKSRMKYFLDPDRGDPKALVRGTTWKVGRGAAVDLSAKEGSLLHEALRFVVGHELKVRCERTAGRRDLVALYEAMYHRRVRGQGRLVFADLPLLLGGKLGATRSFEWEQLRLALEYRLDSTYEHWLFDEFQDTNFAQWGVFENLIAEVLQDPSGRRSVFAVGDVKQSIYLWRDAEPELFRWVESSLPAERTERTPLTKSYRSCPPVLELVNGVFACSDALEAQFRGLNGIWDCPLHESEGEVAKLPGHAALLSVHDELHDGDGKATDAAVAALIREANPLARGLTCAVIVRTNDEAARLSARLRMLLSGEKMEVLCESEEAVAVDNPVTLALLSVFRCAAHPDDSAAWEHLRMTPLLPALPEKSAMLGAEVRAQLVSEGFLGVSRAWLNRIRENAGALDEFSARRGAQFLEIAAEFDESGSRDLDAFVRMAREHRRREEAGARAIQVMTIHKSKGLEFDLVILPQLGAQPMDQARDNLLTCRGERGKPEWFLERPPKSVYEWDGCLVGVVEQAQTRAALEALCRLYVAMTRARRALHVFVPQKPKARSEAHLVAAMLDGDEAREHEIGEVKLTIRYETGEPRWFERASMEPTPGAGPPRADAGEGVEPLAELLRRVNRPVQRRTPSAEERMRLRGADLLSPQREASRGFGTLVHRLFAAIEWVDGAGAAELDAIWREHGLERTAGFEQARRVALSTLEQPEIRPWFLSGGSGRSAWRERSFDLVLGRDWISGQIDRVVLDLAADGQVARATVLDFKTDAVSGDAAIEARASGYAPQLALYRKAVCRLTGLEPGGVRAGLVFTVPGVVRWGPGD